MPRKGPGLALDVGVVAGVSALVVLTFVGRADLPGWPELAATVAAIALLPLLVRRPVVGAVAIGVLAAFSPGVTPTATAAVLTVALRRPLATAAGVAAISAVAHAVQGLLRPTPGLSYGWWLVLDVVVHAALVAAGALVRARQELLTSLRERAERAEADRDREVTAARTHERTLIAREMHDVLAHRLSLVATSAGALEYRPDAAPEQVARMAGVVRAGVHQALEELRDVIGVLRADPAEAGADPGLDRPRPALADLAALVAESRDAGTAVGCSVRVADAAPEAVGRAAYRIVQEGLTNARKHAPGAPVEVAVTGGPGVGLTIEVSNPAGPDSPSTSGSGLIGLAERAAIVGGTLEHGVTAGGRFRLHATLPWPS